MAERNGVTRRKLRMPQQLQLAVWVKENEELLRSMPCTQAALKASDDLGFEISQWSVRRIAAELGVRIRVPKTSKDRPEDRTVLLARAFLQLATALEKEGKQVLPAEWLAVLRNLANRRPVLVSRSQELSYSCPRTASAEDVQTVSEWLCTPAAKSPGADEAGCGEATVGKVTSAS